MIGLLHRRAPVVAFATAEMVAFATWLHVGRADWFYLDEWDFVAGRKAGDLGDLFRSHNGHWTTLPVLAYRLLYSCFGLRTYTPYRVSVIVLYLAAAALLLVVIRRAGVHPWIATAAATLFAFFGAGWENIILPFQITFTGSLVFGLAYLLLADHDGPFDHRDALAIATGLLALMCSGVGLVMVAVAGATVLVRRGRQLALSHVVPLAACYAIWLLTVAREDNTLGHFAMGTVVRFAVTGARASFGAMGPFAAFGIALAVMLILGLAAAVRDRQRSGALDALIAPVALLAGSLALLAITAVNRSSYGSDWARQSRYVSLVSAMAIPALAVAVDALAKRWRWFLPLGIAVFLVGIPANLHAADSARRYLRTRDAATRATMLSLPFAPRAREVPRSLRPDPTTASAVTIGWLLDAAANGRLPAEASRAIPPARVVASNNFRLSFDQRSGVVPATNCRSFTAPRVIQLHRGDSFGVFENAVSLEPVASKLVGILPLFVPSADAPVVVLHDIGAVRVIPVAGYGPARVCTG